MAAVGCDDGYSEPNTSGDRPTYREWGELREYRVGVGELVETFHRRFLDGEIVAEKLCLIHSEKEYRDLLPGINSPEGIDFGKELLPVVAGIYTQGFRYEMALRRMPGGGYLYRPELDGTVGVAAVSPVVFLAGVDREIVGEQPIKLYLSRVNLLEFGDLEAAPGEES